MAKSSGSKFLGAGFLLLVVLFGVSLFTGHMEGVLKALRTSPQPEDSTTEAEEPPGEEIVKAEEPVEALEEIIAPTPEPPAPVPRGNLRKLGNGISYETEIKLVPGEHAATERKRDEAYQARYELTIRQPSAATTLEELEVSNPQLGSLLPELGDLLETARVSPFYSTLYDNKISRVEKSAAELKKLLSRHNFFDCDTILELERPETGLKMLLVQGDMDVVSDGSDGDRLAEMPDEIVNSTHYQPFTSYGWTKTSDRENPMIAGWRQRIKNADAELANPATTAERAAWLRERKKMLVTGIEDMQRRSFLIAEYDPFIVMPVNFLLARDTEFTGKVGDYAVVFYEGRALPAIVGDGGPTFKVGEGSLRLAKELNPRASSYSRPVSTLGVTYLVFCGSAGPKAAPDYDLWHERCQELLDQIGGLGEGVELFRWEDTIPKPEPIVVVPTVDLEPGEEPEVSLEIVPANTEEQTDPE